MKLHISPEAQNDLLEIRHYIATDLKNPDAARELVSKILVSIRGLLTFPDRGTALSSALRLSTDYRFIVCGKYLVFYRHEGERLYVIRVLYGRRNWMKFLFGDDSEEPSP